MFYIILLLISLLTVALLAPLTILYANRFSIVDVANHRSSHTGITPRGGGIVFIIVFYIGFFVYIFITGLPDIPILNILICALVMGIVGWLDDFKDLSVRIRFGIQFVVVLISCIFLPRIWPVIPVVLEKTVIVLAWMWFINLFNFMDGTDGYASQEAFFICIGLFILSSAIGDIALILGVSVLGFLRINYPKAKIFMGDVGSIFLGYILGGFLIYFITINSINFTQAIILTSLFSFDATLTLIKRGLQKKKVWKAHREHWYQRLNISGANHKQIFWMGVVYNLLILGIIELYRFDCISIYTECMICIILFLIFTIYIKKRESFWQQNKR